MTSGAIKEELKQETQGRLDKETEEDKNADEDSIYSNKLPNRLVITVNPRRRYARLNYFVNRARKILRCDETLTITGVDKAISMACALVELLKRQKIAKVTKIATNMNLNPNFARYDNVLAWGQPVPTIVFHMERGEHGTYVTDYHQRKVIEIFEKFDSANTGKLDKSTVEKINLPSVFLSDENQQEQAKKFLDGVEELDLPDFICYCSLLIHPLLKDLVIKEKLAKLGIGAQENTDALVE